MMLARQCGRRGWRSRAQAMTSRPQQRLASTAEASAPAEESNFSRYAGMAFFATISAGTACLGVWQTERYFWKVGMLEEREKQLSAAAVDLQPDATAHGSIDDIEFRQLRLEGKFKAGSTFYLYPRSAPAEASDNVATVKSGGYLYSLLERENGTPVIVNRGFLPRNLLDVHMKSHNPEGDEDVSIVGVLRHGEEKNAFTPDNEPKNRHFYYLEHEELAHAMGLEDGPLPVIIDALAEDGDRSGASLDHPLRKKVQSYVEFYMTPAKHAGYAVTWYSFSVAAVVMAYLRFRKGKVFPKRA